MKTLDALVDYLKTREDVQAFQALETTVLTNPNYKDAYQDVLALQKQLVQASHYNATDQPTLQNAYQHALDALKSTPAVAQYLVLQDELNTMLNQITQLIEAALAKPLDQ